MKWIVLVAALLAGTLSSIADPAGVTQVKAGDPAMEAAFAQARSQTDSFIALLQANAADSFSVKVKITDGVEVEYFWVSNLTYADGVFHGTIDNDPEYVHNVKDGQKIDVKKDGIFDWLYMKNGKMYGNYTVRVLLSKMPKEDADKVRAMLAN